MSYSKHYLFRPIDLQSRFLDLIKEELPESWKHKHGSSYYQLQAELEKLLANPPQRSAAVVNVPRTPIAILAKASEDPAYEAHDEQYRPKPYFEESNRGPRRVHSNSSNQLTNSNDSQWLSPTIRASPTDQLIAAILDGDVQGIRAVVRSKGDDLRSEFWHDLAKSVLPLHRAISGLHFHGSEKLLIATLEVLVQLGADTHAVDHAGNGVLHKAIQVCTSKSVASVVQCLLLRGASPSVMNKEGDTPLHAECKR